VSFKTQSERAAGLFRCFRDLHALGYKIRNPYCLGGRHVRALVQDWTAAEPRARRRTLSPSMVQTELSHLRTLAGWIGKPGLVLPAESYVADPALSLAARRRRRQELAGARVDPQTRSRRSLRTTLIGAQLTRASSLRVKEAVMIRRLAERPPARGSVRGWRFSL
jgi:hypothetical protein